MNRIEEIKSIISSDDNLVIIKNSDIIYSNTHASLNNNVLTLDNVDLKIFYLIDQDVNYTLNISNSVALTEVYYDVCGDVSLTQNYNINANSNVNIVSVIKNGLTRKVQTNVEEGAYLKLDNLYIATCSTNVCTDIILNKSMINCEVNNVIIALCGCTSQLDFNISHLVNNSTSSMVTYAVSKNNSVLNVNTNGIIKKGAYKTDLNQKTKGLILDNDSQISANPILEIDEYDVIASHGAGVGAIDEEELYYLMSRGLRKEESEKLIIGGLIYPFLASIKSENIKNYVSNLINKAL